LPKIQKIQKNQKINENQFVMVFKHGCVVFWECSPEIYSWTLELLKNCEAKALNEEEALTSEYKLVVDETSNKQVIKNDIIYLSKHNLYEKILISYGLMQDLILCRTTYSLNTVIRHSKTLAEYLRTPENKKLDYSMLIKNIGKLYIMRDAFALSRGILDCPKYSFYKSHFSSYVMIRK
jgi:uncharacterized Rmd1/YagE family protein